MCGLCGYFIINGRHTASSKRCVRQFVSMDARGGDAVGWIAAYQGSLEEPTKYTGRVCQDVKDAIRESVRGCTCLVGHTRMATHGDSSYNNDHPHEYENDSVYGAVTHNGVIQSHELTAKENTLDLIGDCDSEVLARLIESYEPDLALESRVADAINACNDTSNIAVAVVEDGNDGVCLVLACRGNPVCYSTKKGILYYASTKESLGKGALSLNEGSMLVVNNDGVEVVRGMLNRLSYFSGLANWQSYRPFKLDPPTDKDDQCGIRREGKWEAFDSYQQKWHYNRKGGST